MTTTQTIPINVRTLGNEQSFDVYEAKGFGSFNRKRIGHIWHSDLGEWTLDLLDGTSAKFRTRGSALIEASRRAA